MRKVLVVILVVVVGVAALGYYQGWFSVTDKDGKGSVHTDPEKFKKDKESFTKTVDEKAKALKNKIAGLMSKSDSLTGDDKAQTQTELKKLEEKRDRLERQIKELDDAGADRFETIKQDLSKDLDEVDGKIEELSKKLPKGSDK
jgi:peptidoglycan hydrolase CwlO-like protein